MSLINDALKKAQKQRTGEAPALTSMPGIGGEPAAKIARRAKPVGFNALLTRIGLGAGALVLILVGGYLALHAARSAPAVVPPSPAPKAQAGAPEATPAAPAPKTAAGAAAAAPAVTFNLPIATAPVEEPAVVTPPPAAAAKPAPVVSPAPVEAKPTAPAPAPKLGPKEINFIESLRIAGIRASATDSKVLMNDRVFRAGDIVEHDLGLKLVGITSNSLTFEDERGARYTRNF